jgi:hypothetical protein
MGSILSGYKSAAAEKFVAWALARDIGALD